MSVDENDLEIRLLETERRLNWALDAIRDLVRRLNADEQQMAMAWTGMGILQSPSTLGNFSPGYSAAGITAAVGTTPGSGTVTLRSLSGGTLSNGSDVTCYNAIADAVDAAKTCIVGQDAQGNYWVVSATC